jgi:phage N-6-adenine-methyltransferase
MSERPDAGPSREALSVHFSSRTDLWATPLSFYAKLDAEFGFTLDVCAIADNAKCARYYTPAEDALRQRWDGTCWMNPPYGRQIGRWIEKAYVSAQQGATVVCLVPARTDTRWWHVWVMRADEIRLVRGRLKFGDGRNSAPFPSAVVVFRPPIEGPPGQGLTRVVALSPAGA